MLLPLSAIGLSQWLSAIFAGMIVLGVLFPIGRFALELIVHTIAYSVSESYQKHVQPLGGYTAYVFNQIVPRNLYAALGVWHRDMVMGALGGILTLMSNKLSAYYRFPTPLALSVLIISWIGWREARMLPYDPFWTSIRMLLWVGCFILLQKILSYWHRRTEGGRTHDA